MKAMLPTEIDKDAVRCLLNDSDWAIQQKHDGARVLAKVNLGKVETFLHRNGGPIKHTATTQHLPAIKKALRRGLDRFTGYVDGEVVNEDGGRYEVFDLYDKYNPHLDYAIRNRMLHDLIPPSDKVRLVKTYSEQDAKVDFLHRAEEAGIEGVILRHLYKPYVQARTTHVLKHKFVKSVDLIVTGRSTEPMSATLGAIDPHTSRMVTVGACSMIGKPPAQVGDVVEVQFLYWTGSSLYQPRLVRIREDKSTLQCTLDQFKPYTREVLR